MLCDVCGELGYVGSKKERTEAGQRGKLDVRDAGRCNYFLMYKQDVLILYV